MMERSLAMHVKAFENLRDDIFMNRTFLVPTKMNAY